MLTTVGASLSRRALLAGSIAGMTGGLVGCTPDPDPQPTLSPSREPEVAVFGDQFRFGVATSAYQIEGSTKADGRGASIWDTFCAQSGRIDDGSSGEVACDHYRRWESGGSINRAGLDFYKRLVDGLQQRRIAAVATLFHWDLPQGLQDRGGWENRDCTGWFGDYASVVVDALDGVHTWLTINEPKIIVQQGYQLGWMAPGLQDNTAAGRAIHHLGLAHGLAVQAFRASGHSGEIGPVPVLSPVYPADGDAADQAKLRDVWENTLYLDPILRGRYPAEIDQLD
ncbi:MAG: beta-galactosidase, partial [Geminicoccaceae bacterium]|nr:beta-galactosidase [Geminicoccaceae bacterium]